MRECKFHRVLIKTLWNRMPGSTCVYPPRTHANKNICKTCCTTVKLTMGRRMCTHYCANRDNEFAADTVNKILGTVDAQDRYPPTVTYVRGLEEHTSRDVDETITELEAAIHPTRAPRTGLAMSTRTTTGRPGHACEGETSDDLLDKEDDIPPYRTLDEESSSSDAAPPSPQPGPVGNTMLFQPPCLLKCM